MAKVIIDTAKAHEIARRYQSGSLTTHIINEIIRSGTPVEETKEKENENGNYFSSTCGSVYFSNVELLLGWLDSR